MTVRTNNSRRAWARRKARSPAPVRPWRWFFSIERRHRICAHKRCQLILRAATALTKSGARLMHLARMQYTQLFRRLREQKGLSHEALAKLARCHRNTVLNVESGRAVKFKTLARLMSKMGYASNSLEMCSVAVLWLEAVSGVDLADPSTLGSVRQKLAVYDRSL